MTDREQVITCPDHDQFGADIAYIKGKVSVQGNILYLILGGLVVVFFSVMVR